MICSTALEASSTRMPCWITARGSRASTRLRRFCTSTEAWLVSVPGTKLAMISTWPSESLVEFEIQNARGAVELLLDQPRHAVVEIFRRRAGIAGRDRDRGRRDDRILRDRQQRNRDQADQADEKRDHPGEDRPVNEEARHRILPVHLLFQIRRCVRFGPGLRPDLVAGGELLETLRPPPCRRTSGPR